METINNYKRIKEVIANSEFPINFYVPKAGRLNNSALSYLEALQNDRLISPSKTTTTLLRQETIALSYLIDPFDKSFGIIGYDMYLEQGLNVCGVDVIETVDSTKISFGFGIPQESVSFNPQDILNGRIVVVTKYRELLKIALAQCLFVDMDELDISLVNIQEIIGDSEYTTRKLQSLGIATTCADIMETGNSMRKFGLLPYPIFDMPTAVLIGRIGKSNVVGQSREVEMPDV